MDGQWRNRIVGTGEEDPNQLLPNPENWRTHPKFQEQSLKGVLRDIGMIQFVIVNKTTGHLVDGHLRCELAISEGQEKIPVVYVELTPEEEMEALATFDPISWFAGADKEKLKGVLEAVKTERKETEDLIDEIRKQMNLREKGERGDGVGMLPSEKEALQAKWGTEDGQIWECSAHRILCGDSTDEANVKKLLKGDQIHCVFTDPPYGIEYQDQGEKFEKIKNDELAHDKLIAFLAAGFKAAAKHVHREAAWYIWHAAQTRKQFEIAMKMAGLEERQYIIWAKPSPNMGGAHYQWSHEPCFYACGQGFDPAWYGGRGESSVWRFALGERGIQAAVIGRGVILNDGMGAEIFVTAVKPKDKKLRTLDVNWDDSVYLQQELLEHTVWEVKRDQKPMHPTQKPMELACRAILNSTRRDEVVYDGFSGSGTLMLAAEKLGRVARLIEMDPGYVAVTLERMTEVGVTPKQISAAKKE